MVNKMRIFRVLISQPNFLEDSSDRGVDDLGWGSRPGMQFTSFANVLMTTCGSPTNKNFSSAWGSIPGGCKRQEDSVPSSSSAWSKSSDLTIPKSLSYAQVCICHFVCREWYSSGKCKSSTRMLKVDMICICTPQFSGIPFSPILIF